MSKSKYQYREPTYNYYVLTNGRVIAPIEDKLEEIENAWKGNCGESFYYETKSGILCHKYTYPTDIDFNDDIGRADYCDYVSEREYLGKIEERFNNIDQLLFYLKLREKKITKKRL